MIKNQHWVGRFAPTPSGLLHFGSLVAALGSYLISKHRQGEWLVRIEDLDPPREVAGAAKSILHTLEHFGFEWDREVIYQSQREHAYTRALQYLNDKKLTYHCDCSRNLILQRNNSVYDSYCENRQLTQSENTAIRIKFANQFSLFNQFDDAILGHCCLNQAEDQQDFVIKRRDGLFAYQLAVVVDDIEQGVNHVVRGADILDSTPRQNFLYACFKQTPPDYFHLPLVLNQAGEKFSKTKLSPAIEPHQASLYLIKALQHLDQKTQSDWIEASPKEILQQAITNWSTKAVSQTPKTY